MLADMTSATSIVLFIFCSFLFSGFCALFRSMRAPHRASFASSFTRPPSRGQLLLSLFFYFILVPFVKRSVRKAPTWAPHLPAALHGGRPAVKHFLHFFYLFSRLIHPPVSSRLGGFGALWHHSAPWGFSTALTTFLAFLPGRQLCPAHICRNESII
jgi:hypothetical protein